MKKSPILSLTAATALAAGATFAALGFAQPQTPPSQPKPAQPSTPRPNQPTQPTQPNRPNDPARPGDRTTPGQPRTMRYERPFAFADPTYESRFMESSHRLIGLERRMAEQNKDLQRRLGEVRQMTGDRQTTALYGLLQDLLNEQAALQAYLVQSRTAWSGDIDLPDNTDPTNPRSPSSPPTPTNPTPNPTNPR